MPLPDFSMLENRLRKNLKHLQKWARREKITCFRVYDADIPEFPLAVDQYGGFLYVAEYKRKHPLSDAEYLEWQGLSLEVLARVFDIPADRIFLKSRAPQKGKQQYEKTAEVLQEFLVEEGGLHFLVNPGDYLDTGLFLDHRITRQLVRELAAGKDVLNLFAYTGSFSVYAAAGGALSTTTIDLSNTYLNWAKKNMALNGFGGKQHAFIRADVKAWLRETPLEEAFDLVVLDPPTFSNSKRMKDDVLDTQRDHSELINHCLERMRPGGTLFFSTNYRQFQLDTAAIQSSDIKDITAQTIPEDFRNKKIHYCFKIKKG